MTFSMSAKRSTGILYTRLINLSRAYSGHAYSTFGKIQSQFPSEPETHLLPLTATAHNAEDRANALKAGELYNSMKQYYDNGPVHASNVLPSGPYIYRPIKSPNSLAQQFHKTVLKDGNFPTSGIVDEFVEAPYLYQEIKDLVCEKYEYMTDPQRPHTLEDEIVCAGLYNLGGTTSYMNATIQCLHSVPELKLALNEFKRNRSSNQSSDHIPAETRDLHMLTAATRDLFNELEGSVKRLAPNKFLQLFRKIYPDSYQQNSGDHTQQPDAEECWKRLLNILFKSLKSPGFSSEDHDVKALFNIELVKRMHCKESSQIISERCSSLMLHCRLSGMMNSLLEGLKHFLTSGQENASIPLQCSAEESCIDVLPRYLTIRFVESGSTKFKTDPMILDVYELCSDELRKKLDTPRRVDQLLKKRDKLRKRLSNGSGESCIEATSKEGEREAQLTGIYDLVAVLSLDRDNYLANIKYSPDYWVQFNNEYHCTAPDVAMPFLLRGCYYQKPYIAMYKARTAPLQAEG